MRRESQNPNENLRGQKSTSDTCTHTNSELDLLNLSVHFTSSQRRSPTKNKFEPRPRTSEEITRIIDESPDHQDESVYPQHHRRPSSAQSHQSRESGFHNQLHERQYQHPQSHRSVCRHRHKTHQFPAKSHQLDSSGIHQHGDSRDLRTSSDSANRKAPVWDQYLADNSDYRAEQRIRDTQDECNDNFILNSPKSTFPFKHSPSGHLKIIPNQVVFESKKVSVLVADPQKTKICVQNDSGSCNPQLEPQAAYFVNSNYQKSPFTYNQMEGEGERMNPKHSNQCVEYPDSVSDVLQPEFKLERLGVTNTEPFDWNAINMHPKTNIYEELDRRITNYINSDCTVYIENEEFHCHLIVLQCYSQYFEEVTNKRVDLRNQSSVTPKAFATIYGWMISHHDESYKLLTRDNILDIMLAAKYLSIKELEEQCWSFIDSVEVFNEDTAFLLYLEAKKKGLEEIMHMMVPRIRHFFLTLVSSQDFLDLSAEEVCALLSSNYILINCEMEVLMSAVRWLRVDWKSRSKHLVELMRCVRFGWIEPWQLIDVKRNPENPEFLAIMKNTEVQRMADDGLAYVIIKYWYGHKTEDFQHWLEVLGLEEPAPRNMSGVTRNYITFRQFLHFLDTNRNEVIMEKTLPREVKKHHEDKASKPTHRECVDVPTKKHPVPTMKDLLASRQVQISPEKLKTFADQHTVTNIIPDLKRSPVSLNTEQSVELIPKLMEKNIKPHPPEQIHTQEPENPLKLFNQNVNESGVKPSRLDVFSVFDRNHETSPFIYKSEFARKSNYFLAEGSLFSKDRETVLVFGGIDPHSQYGIGRNTGKDVYRYIPESNVWEFVTELPEPRHHHSVGFLKGRIYLVGGADPRDDDIRGKSVVVNTVWSFEPVVRTWYNEPPMNIPRKNLGLVVCRQGMYAIGGQDRMGRVLASVEKYDPDSGTWVDVAPLKSPRMGVACTKYRDCIWVAGGMSGSKKNPLSNEVEFYSSRNNQWTQITNLRFPRCFAQMFVLQDKLYLIGGAGQILDKDKSTSSIEAIDVWDNESKEWKLISEMAIPRHGHSVACIGTQILMIGGVTTVYMRALSNVECYCVERGTWVRGVASLPTTLSGHGAITLPPAALM